MARFELLSWPERLYHQIHNERMDHGISLCSSRSLSLPLLRQSCGPPLPNPSEINHPHIYPALRRIEVVSYWYGVMKRLYLSGWSPWWSKASIYDSITGSLSGLEVPSSTGDTQAYPEPTKSASLTSVLHAKYQAGTFLSGSILSILQYIFLPFSLFY